MVAQGRVRRRATGPRPPDQPVLPALRHPAVRRRTRPAGRLPAGLRPGRHGQVPASHAARGARRASSRGPTCSSGRPRRGRWSPTPRWRCTRTRPTWWRRRSRDGDRVVVAEDLFARVLGDGWHVAARFSGQALARGELPAPVRPHRYPRRPHRRSRVIRDHGRRHRPGPPGAGVRRRRHERVARVRPARGQPDPAGRAVRGRRAAGRRDVLQGRRPAADQRPRRPRAAVPVRTARAQLPALLAVRHRAAVLRGALVVHQDHRDQGQAAGRERADQLVPGDGQVRPVRRVAAEQRGLGAVPDQVLGHAAAAVGVRASRI